MEDNIKYILIVSQSIAGEQFADFASELAELIKNKKNLKIIFKYHPNELTKNFKVLEKDNIIQLKNLNYSIYQLQKYSYCQIGAYSTGLYEGLCFELPTIILKGFPGSDGTIETLNYMSKGIYHIKTCKQLLDIIENLEKPLKKEIDLLWKSNSLNNIKEEIYKIINHDA